MTDKNFFPASSAPLADSALYRCAMGVCEGYVSFDLESAGPRWRTCHCNECLGWQRVRRGIAGCSSPTGQEQMRLWLLNMGILRCAAFSRL